MLVIAGLCASTLHLANPRNAWRSLTRWRTSWLSREALVALVFIPVAIALHRPACFRFDVVGRCALAGAMVLLAWAMLYCTAMIYASLKPIRQWHTARVPLAFLLLGHASGALLVVCASSVERRWRPAGSRRGAGAVRAALLVKLEYWRFVGAAAA